VGAAGLSYNLHRWYERGTGRYERVDPIGLSGGDHLFAYSEGAPSSRVDPRGLASCTYSITKRRLRCRENAGKSPLVVEGPGVFSGFGLCRNDPKCIDKKEEGPVPPGIYRMNRDERPGREMFWRLEREDKDVSGFDHYFLGERSGFMLHPGSFSYGCITLDRENEELMSQYRRINDILENEDGENWIVVVRD
jgi:hypothetical protein